MHSNVAVVKLKSNESESAKKMHFSGLLFFLSILELVHLQLQSLGYTSHRRKKDLASGVSLSCIQVQIKLRVHIL